MLNLNTLLSRKGLESKRRNHEKETGLKYFYELYLIENEIMSKEFTGKTYITISLSSIISKTKKNNGKATYGRRELIVKISEHLDIGNYKWDYKFGRFIITIQDKVVNRNYMTLDYKRCMCNNFMLLFGCVLPVYIAFFHNKRGISLAMGYVCIILGCIAILEMLFETIKFMLYYSFLKVHLKHIGVSTKPRGYA